MQRKHRLKVHESVGELALKIMAFTMAVVAEKVMDDKPMNCTEHRQTWLMAFRTKTAAASELAQIRPGRLTDITCTC